jgi:hypothetical protein
MLRLSQIVTITLLLALTVPVSAAELRGTVEAGEWTVGDRIGLTLVLVHEPGLVPALPEVEGRLGPFAVRDFSDGGAETLEDGRIAQTWRFSLVAFETGDLEVPAVSVSLTGGAEGTLAVESEPIAVTIRSVLPEGEEATDIADIRPPAELPYSFVPLLVWSPIGLALLIGLLWLWARIRARRRDLAQVDEASLLPPRELAIRELQRLTASDLLKQDRYKAFYIAISGIVDRLFQRAMGVVTVERTSGEILRDLRQQAAGSPVVSEAGAFYGACDRVKFSRHVPGDAENSDVIAAAYRLVDLAAPEPVEADNGEGD